MTVAAGWQERWERHRREASAAWPGSRARVAHSLAALRAIALHVAEDDDGLDDVGKLEHTSSLAVAAATLAGTWRRLSEGIARGPGDGDGDDDDDDVPVLREARAVLDGQGD